MTPDPIDRARAFFAEDERPERPRHGKYELVCEAGRGGMAVVWEAWDPELKRRVALKILTGGNLERLRREAEAAARLRHPGVVAVHEVGLDYLAMDFIEGSTFDVAHPRRLELLEQAAEAVAHAHAQGVVHRDLKPQNLLVTPEGRVVLTDFGLARIEGAESLTRTGAVVGTPHYMAPEQVRGEVGRIGPATDVWALGVLLYEAVADRKPFDGPTPLAIHDAIVRTPAPALPGDVGSVVAKCLEKDPARRYPDAAAFLADLRNVKGGSRADARRSDAGRWLRRNALILALFAASALILAGGFWLGDWVTDERRRAVEALRDQAKISLEAALELRRAGANDRMRQFLPAMEAAYREAVGRAPDLPEVHWLMGRMYRALMEHEKALDCQMKAARSAAGYPPADYEAALLMAAAEARRVKVSLDGAMGEGRVFSAEDVDTQRIAVRAEAFLASKPQGPERRIAEALVRLCGKNEHAKAQALLEEVLGADPNQEDARLVLAWAIQSEMLPGVEAREKRWKDAEAVYTASLERDRGYVPNWMARGQLRFSRGSARRHRGLDPTADYEGAEADFAAVLALVPGDLEARTWRGQIRTYRGIWAMEQGKSPLGIFDDADAAFKHVLWADPEAGRAALWRGNTAFYRGMWLLAEGLDPLPAFKDAEIWLDVAAKFPPGERIELRWRGRILAQVGAALARRGDDPRTTFLRAEMDFNASGVRPGAADGSRKPDAWHLMWWSTVYSERARWLALHGEEADRDLKTAGDLLDEALRVMPNFGEALRHRAMLRYQEGETRLAKNDRPGAAAAFAKAAADFEAALAVNPNFRYQVGDRDATARKKADELR
jgi:tetratricopeptide (TPR) repeat protein